MEYTYILAPQTENNFAVLQQAIIDFPQLVENRQIKTAYLKTALDIVASDGSLLIPADPALFIYLKAKTSEISPELLDQVTDYKLFSINTQPFSTYWI